MNNSREYRPGSRLAWRMIALCAAAIAAAVALFSFPPIPQDPNFHNFADQRTLWGIPHFGDVITNLGFALVGLFGLWRMRLLWRARGPSRFPYLHLVLFFVALTSVALGSSYYHWEPDNAALFWDRLPITLSFMILFAIIIGERIPVPAARQWPLPVLVAAGLATLCYWIITENAGHGDLRPYALVQLYPLLLSPLMIMLFRRGDVLGDRPLLLMVLLYVAAKGFERMDEQVLTATFGIISGHSVKHLLAAAALVPLFYTPAMRNRGEMPLQRKTSD